MGPGVLNPATGAAYAHLGAMPMILITGQKPIRGSQQARFQIVDMVAIMKPLTKVSRQIISPGSIPTRGGIGGADRAVRGAPSSCFLVLHRSVPNGLSLQWVRTRRHLAGNTDCRPGNSARRIDLVPGLAIACHICTTWRDFLSPRLVHSSPCSRANGPARF